MTDEVRLKLYTATHATMQLLHHNICITRMRYTGAPETRGQLPPLPLLHGGSKGAEKCPFAM